MKTKPDIEALHQLIRVLEQVEQLPVEKFDMDYYKMEIKCGFSACAYGHAMFDPWFAARHNLEWQPSSGNSMSVPLLDGEHDDVVTRGYLAAPGQRDQVFGLTVSQFGDLFMPDNYTDEDEPDKYADGIRPYHVIERVKQLLAELAAEEQST